MQLHHTGFLLFSYESPYVFYLLHYRIRARASGGISLFHAGPEVESPVYVLLYEIGEHPEFFERQFLKSASPAQTIRDYLARYIVGIPERHTFYYQVIRHVSRIDVSLFG